MKKESDENAPMNSPTYMPRSSSTYTAMMNTKSDRPTMLCDLPTEILHKILHSIPIQEAVRTCVLSRSWEHLWRSMPSLLFVQSQPRAHFVNFFDKVCSLRDPLYPIKTFELCCDVDDPDALRISSILGGAVITNVRHMEEIRLVLSNYCEAVPFVLPSSICSLEKLVRLVLRSRAKKVRLELPDSIVLPKLKLLDVEGVDFKNRKSLQKLFSSPLLEELAISKCFRGPVVSDVNIYNRSLKKLSIRDHPPTIWLKCGNLKELNFHGDLVHGFHITDGCTDLENVMLGFGESSVGVCAVSLLERITSMKSLILRLGLEPFKVVSDDLHQRLRSLQFGNLIKLCLVEFKTLDAMAQTVLRNSPSLDLIIFQGDEDRPPLESSVLLNPVPTCFKTRVKKIVVSITGVEDVDFLATLLKIGEVLERLLVLIPSWVEDTVVEMVCDMLHNLPVASKHLRYRVYIKH